MATTAGPKERVGLMEQPVTGMQTMCCISTHIIRVLVVTIIISCVPCIDDDGTDAKESCHTATKTANPIAIGAQFFAPDFLLIAVSKTTNT